ncbi:MAG: hypothetical protein JO081_08210, partial [Alphaproteobacteria bacterium]|nr:hypothetical protein [Alphaproteobacteria bacterium]
MELPKKVKLALDETRILILGAQILLGFQFRGVFRDGYDRLAPGARLLDAVALALMICVVGLLIMPGPYHRVVEGGEDTGNFHRLVTAVAEIVLLPFAVALGFDLVITTDLIFGKTTGWIAGSSASAVALTLWYGFPQSRKWQTGAKERRMTQAQADEV